MEHLDLRKKRTPHANGQTSKHISWASKEKVRAGQKNQLPLSRRAVMRCPALAGVNVM